MPAAVTGSAWRGAGPKKFLFEYAYGEFRLLHITHAAFNAASTDGYGIFNQVNGFVDDLWSWNRA